MKTNKEDVEKAAELLNIKTKCSKEFVIASENYQKEIERQTLSLLKEKYEGKYFRETGILSEKKYYAIQKVENLQFIRGIEITTVKDGEFKINPNRQIYICQAYLPISKKTFDKILRSCIDRIKNMMI